MGYFTWSPLTYFQEQPAMDYVSIGEELTGKWITQKRVVQKTELLDNLKMSRAHVLPVCSIVCAERLLFLGAFRTARIQIHNSCFLCTHFFELDSRCLKVLIPFCFIMRKGYINIPPHT